jgi:uncharacterized protein
MALTVNLRHLEEGELHLKGELPLEELDIDTRDEVIQLTRPLKYDIEVQEMENGLLAQGSLDLLLSCECVRCLKKFDYPVRLPQWAAHLAFQGEEPTPVINDCVDLTPAIRDDILLEFPQHPLCDPECRGLPKTTVGKAKNTSGEDDANGKSSPWSELNKLKF